MVMNVLITCMGVESHTCLKEENVVLETDSTIYKQLPLCYNSITKSIDTRTVHEEDTSKYEYSINTEEFVSKFIVDENFLSIMKHSMGEQK